MPAVSEHGARRWAWVALALILLVALGLRLWGIKQGLPYAYNSDENAHFVPRAIGMFVLGPNPEYFANPPAFTYLLHAIFAVWFGGRAGVSHEFALHPGAVFVVARATTALLGTLAVWLLYLAGARLLGRAVALLACALMAVAFLPVFYAHLALNDVPTLAPLTLCLLGSARVLSRGGKLDYALAGIGLGLGCATKYTAGIVVVPLLAAAAWQFRAATPKARRRTVGGLALAGALALASFVIANPYSVLDFQAFHGGITHQSQVSQEGQGKLGASHEGGILYYLWSFTWGLGWVPSLAALGGVVTVWRRSRRVGWMLVPAPLLFLAFMGLQGRYFGRWLLPIFPVVCLLAALFAVQAGGLIARGLVRLPGLGKGPRTARAVQVALGAVTVLALCGQGALYSVHSGMAALARGHSQPDAGLDGGQRAGGGPRRGRAGGAGPLGAGHRASDPEHAQRLSLDQVSGAGLGDRPRRFARARGDAAGGEPRGLRAHAEPGADRPLRAVGVLLGGERLHPVRPGGGGAPRGAAGARLLPSPGPGGRSGLPRHPLRSRGGPGGVRLRLDV